MATYRIRIITALILLFAATANADVLVQYAITGGSLNTTTNASGIAGGTLTNASLSTFSAASPGYSTDPVIRMQSPSTSASAAVTANAYFSFSVTPTNMEMDLTNLTFKAARGGASTPRGYVVRSSIDSYAANIQTADLTTQFPTFSDITVDLSGALYQNLTSAITFRIYVYAPASSNVEMDAITVNGTATSTQGGTGTTTFDTFDDAAPVLTRYVQIQRSGTTLTAKIYSDENYSVLLDTLTVTATADTYRYLYAPLSNNTGVSGTVFSGSVQNLNTNVQLGSTCTDVCSLCSNQTDCEAAGGITCYWWTDNTCNATAQSTPTPRYGIGIPGCTISGATIQ